jgi:MFS family permease
MMVADLMRFALVVVLTLLATRHTVSLATLGPTAALIGAGEGLFLPGSLAIMPSLVEVEQLAAGNAISSAAVQAGSLIGPAIGGALVAVTGASTGAFGVDAASFAVSALTLALIPGRRGASAPEEGAPGSIAQWTRSGGVPDSVDCAIDTLGEGAGAAAGAATSEGAGVPGVSGTGSQDAGGVLNLLRRSRELQVILVVVVAANLAGGGMGEVALPALAHARWGAAGYGALLACLAAGAVAGTLAAARSGRLTKPTVFAGSVFLVGAAAICLIPYLGGEPGAAAALLIMGACQGFGNTVFLTVAQKEWPPQILGRVMGAVMLCAFGSFPLSVAVTGILIRHIGAVPFFPIAGGLLAIAMAAGLASREFRSFGAGAPMPL